MSRNVVLYLPLDFKTFEERQYAILVKFHGFKTRYIMIGPMFGLRMHSSGSVLLHTKEEMIYKKGDEKMEQDKREKEEQKNDRSQGFKSLGCCAESLWSGSRRWGGKCCPHVKDTCSFGPLTQQTTRFDVPEDSNPQSRHCENLNIPEHKLIKCTDIHAVGPDRSNITQLERRYIFHS